MYYIYTGNKFLKHEFNLKIANFNFNKEIFQPKYIILNTKKSEND